MKDKLKLKELAIYLPYGLPVLYNGFFYEIIGLKEDSAEISVLSPLDSVKTVPFSEIIPIFRSLKDLTKEISHGGEKFIPLDRLNQLGIVEEISESNTPGKYWINQRKGKYSFKALDISEVPYEIIDKLLSWHFDIFDALGRGVAIEITERVLIDTRRLGEY